MIFGSWFYSGFFPIASGTFASLIAVLLYWFIPGFDHWPILAAASALAFAIGVPCATSLEKSYGNDPSIVVIDEIAGMWISLLFLPKIWYLAVAGFFLFRLFDIIKPPPARQFDAMTGGFGIMLDDVAAGIYANLVLQIFWLIVR